MNVQANAISDERRQRAYRQGMSFRQFIDQAKTNKELMLSNYDACDVTLEELDAIRRLDHPVDVIVLAQDWCGDVASNLPLFAKIEQLTGKLKLHILNRDPDNWDIAEAYPAKDGKTRIPTYIFFNHKGEQLGVFIERPEEITAMIPAWRQRFWEQHPQWNWDGRSLDAIGEEGVAAWRAFMMAQRQAVRHIEKEAIIRAIESIVA
jgi:hypothetical protein